MQQEVIIRGLSLEKPGSLAIHTKDGLITAIERSAQPADCFVAPGLVDLQINGCMGIDFNTLPLTAAMLSKAVNALIAHGETSVFPTLVTNSMEHLEELADIIVRARQQDPQIAHVIRGLHLEGPFISPQAGARGAHPAEYICAPDWEKFLRLQERAQGLIKIITLSPEWPEAEDFIKKAVASGVLVSIGHSMADHEQIRRAIAAGATLSTHLGNGAPPVLPRHPNFIWSQLAADELDAGLICDGFHLPAEVLKVFFRAKRDRFFITSDAVSLSGLPPGRYHTHIGGDVILTEYGKLCTAEDERILAGSVRLLPQAIEFLISRKLLSPAEAWYRASAKPAEIAGLQGRGKLEVGAAADLVLFKTENQRIQIKEVYAAGRKQAL